MANNLLVDALVDKKKNGKYSLCKIKIFYAFLKILIISIDVIYFICCIIWVYII